MITLNIDNTITKIVYSSDESAFLRNKIDTDIWNLLSYTKGDASIFKKKMIDKYKRAKEEFSKHGHGLSRIDYKLYKFSFITWDKLVKFIEDNSIVPLYDKVRNNFPTGLLSNVLEYFRLNDVKFTLNDLRRPPISSFKLKKLQELPPLRPYQKEALEKLLTNCRGVVEAATGTGKTLLIKELIAAKGLKTLVVVPSTNILNIFDEELKELFGKKSVGVITGGRKKEFDKPILVATYQSLPKLPKEFFDTIEMIVGDEFHHNSNNTLYDLNMTHFNSIYYRYGFTATNFRNDGSDMALQAVLSDTLHSYDFLKAIQEGYLTPVNFIIYNNKADFHDNWRDEVTNDIIENEAYHNTVANIANKLDKNNISTIVFVDEIKHGEALKGLIPNAVFINGTESKKDNKRTLEKFNSREFNILIGTSVIGEGVNTVPARVGILAGGGKAESNVVQKIGRLLRLDKNKPNATLIDFAHIGSKHLHRHHRARKAIYDQYKGTVTYKEVEV